MQVYLIDLESTGVDPLLEAGDRVYRVQVKASTYKTGEAYVFLFGVANTRLRMTRK